MTSLFIRLFIKDRDNTKDESVRCSYGNLGSVVGILCNVVLCIIKILTGVFTASISIIADGLNNLSDMGSSIITMIGFRLSGKPADRDHPFGHGRIEYMSAFIVSVFILIVGFELLISSVRTLISGEVAPKYTVAALILLGISIPIKLWMFAFNRKLGKTIDSAALTATAQDSINDAIATFAILVASIVSMVFTVPFNLDAIMAIFVSLFILWSGISSAKDTMNEILGGPPEKELIDAIEHDIMSFEPFVGIHDLMVHNYGPGRQFASVHVEVPQDIDIVKCHEQIDLCEKFVCEKTGVELVIHMDPIDTNNETVKTAKEDIITAIKQIDENLSLHDFRMTPAAGVKTNLIFDVVVPDGIKITLDELKEKISAAAKEVNPTYCCVITFDNDYTGGHF